VAVLAIDKEQRRISLGLKQVESDPWPQLAEKYSPGMEIKGKITRLFDRGAITDVGEGIEGFVPISQLGIDDLKKSSDAFLEGEELTLRVTRVEVANHRLVLSAKAWLTEQDDVTLAEWTAARNRARAMAQQAAQEEKPGESVKKSTEDGEGGERAEEETPAGLPATAEAPVEPSPEAEAPVEPSPEAEAQGTAEPEETAESRETAEPQATDEPLEAAKTQEAAEKGEPEKSAEEGAESEETTNGSSPIPAEESGEPRPEGTGVGA
jgi:predicted RNA-binding protein with RPS1 domain